MTQKVITNRPEVPEGKQDLAAVDQLLHAELALGSPYQSLVPQSILVRVVQRVELISQKYRKGLDDDLRVPAGHYDLHQLGQALVSVLGELHGLLGRPQVLPLEVYDLPQGLKGHPAAYLRPYHRLGR